MPEVAEATSHRICFYCQCYSHNQASVIPEQDTDEGEDNGAKLLDREVLPEESEEATVVPPAGQEETEDTGETAVVESNLPRLENLVRLPSMFDRRRWSTIPILFARPPTCVDL